MIGLTANPAWNLHLVLIVAVAVALSGCEWKPTSEKQTDRFLGAICNRNLSTLHSAIKEYAALHQGQVPTNIEVLVRDGHISLAAWNEVNSPLVCAGAPSDGNLAIPESNAIWADSLARGEGCSYTLNTGLKTIPAAKTWLATEAIGNHRGVVHVLFTDGSIEAIPKADLQRTISNASGLK